MSKIKSTRPQKYFGKHREPLVKMPNLVESQLTSFRQFVEKGLRAAVHELAERSELDFDEIRHLHEGLAMLAEIFLRAHSFRFSHFDIGPIRNTQGSGAARRLIY